ncbi:MAG: DUF4166 domain-containing protein [Pseudoclavibacter sp.]
MSGWGQRSGWEQRSGWGQSSEVGRSAPGERSVYELVLGDEVAQLHPQLGRYFGLIPADHEGRGRGVYSWAGPRHRVLRPVFAWLAWRRILFPERGRDVPFTVVNSPDATGGLSARREFEFARVTRVMEDTMRVVQGEDGTARLVDRLGRGRGLEVDLELRVHDGGLRMRSTRLGLRMRVPVLERSVPVLSRRGRARGCGVGVRTRTLRVPLPRLVTMTLDERAHPDGNGRQRVDVRLRAPLLGDVFRYIGDFEYAVVPRSSSSRS